MKNLFELFIRDNATLKIVAQIDYYTSMNLILKFNQVSSWEVRIPADIAAAQYITPDYGVIIRKDGATILSGPIRKIETSWSNRDYVILVSGKDDMTYLAERIVLPDPAGMQYGSPAHDIRTGKMETIMFEYVQYHAGVSALTERQVPNLITGTDLARGNTITARGRFDELLKFLKDLAELGGGYGFKVVQTAGNLVFSVYEPTDLTDSIIFSSDLGNTLEWTYTQAAPKSNYVYIGGQNQLEDRELDEGSDADSVTTWGRIEKFKDQRNAETPEELAEWLDKILTQDAVSDKMSITPIDTEAVTYGVDYNIGDKVRAIAGTKVFESVITEVKIAVSGQKIEITPFIGTRGFDSIEFLSETFTMLYDLDERVKRMEVI